MRRPHFGKCNAKKMLIGLFPIFTWLSQYNFQKDIAGDLISGCTVAIMHIPQGMY